MIDPEDITKYDRTTAELEEFWLFCLIVAGKTTKTQARALERFLKSLPDGSTPFTKIAKAIQQRIFDDKLKESKLGQYTRLASAFRESQFLDLRNCTTEQMEEVHGVGPKTSRLFIMHTRENQRIAAIDTHILKLLRERGYDVPKATPPAGPKYRELEQIFLGLADEAGMSPADYDLMTLQQYEEEK